MNEDKSLVVMPEPSEPDQSIIPQAMDGEKMLLDPFDKQPLPKPEGDERFIVCPHCGMDVPLSTYPELNFGDFKCRNCGAYRDHFQWEYLEWRPGYFMEGDGFYNNYVARQEWDEYLQRRRSLRPIIHTIFTDQEPALPGEQQAALPDSNEEPQ